MNILGIDPGFANVGYAVASIDHPFNMDNIRGVAIGVIETKPSHKKKKIYVEDDNIQRAKYIVKHVSDIITQYSVEMITMEAFSNNRMNASSSRKSYGTVTSIAAISEIRNKPLFIATPQQIKICICDNKKASKQEIIDTINNRYPVLKALSPKAKTKHEHCYDAFASIITCLEEYDIIQLMVR